MNANPTNTAAADSVYQPTPRPNRHWRRSWPLLLVLLTAICTTLRYQPPAAQPETAPADAFSAARAFRHVETIAAAPHARGTLQNAAVRDYIVAELTKLGLAPEIQRAIALPAPTEARLPLPVENIVAKIAGTTSGSAVMLVAHYDSMPKAPGAGDNAAAVASLLETARALRSGPPLRNDVLFLFTDGEEYGLLGARAFVVDPNALKAIGVVFNFDARGTRGPSIMFETSSNNRDLISVFAQAAPNIVANSLTASVYRWLPNSTDFTVFQKAGLPGLNFAFIGGSEHYHRPTDDLAHLSRRTLQQTGQYALSLAKHFGMVPLPLTKNGDAVYFTAIPPLFIYYPFSWVKPLAWLLVFIAAIVSLGLFRRKQISCFGVGLQFTFLLASILVSVVCCWVLYRLRVIVPKGYADTAWWLFMALAVAIATKMAADWFGSRRVILSEQVFAGLALISLIAGASVVVLPGGSFLFYWPALTGWIALGLHGWRLGMCEPKRTPFILLLAPIVSAIIVGPVLFLLWQALPQSLPMVGGIAVLIFGMVPSIRQASGAASK